MNYTVSNPQKIAVAVIPARFASSRLPGKPLLEIAGKPMICHVAERASAAKTVKRVIVATDDDRVLHAVTNAGFDAVMTRPDHASGTDRLAEVAATIADADVIVNVQGDEPLISPFTIDHAVEALLSDHESSIATTWEPFTSAADVLSPDVVKVAVDEFERAIYFSRAPIPWPREAVRRYHSLQHALSEDHSLINQFRKHTGLYVYDRSFLLQFARWPVSTLERIESLEQLRALEHGARIKVVRSTGSSVGVDTVEDLELVRKIFVNATGVPVAQRPSSA